MTKVYSGKPPELEAGFQPHLEAVFKDKKEAEEYVKTWIQFYPKMDVIFWTEE
jgi:hypothetical protein